MSRRRAAKKRVVSPDAKYQDVLVGKLINILMRDGKKQLAERILYDVMSGAESSVKKPALEVLKQAIDNIKPSLEVCSRRLGGATYQVPREISDHRSRMLAIKWLVRAAKSRKKSSMKDKLYEEVMEAYSGRGFAVKMRDDLYKLAEANKAFAHFRW